MGVGLQLGVTFLRDLRHWVGIRRRSWVTRAPAVRPATASDPRSASRSDPGSRVFFRRPAIVFTGLLVVAGLVAGTALLVLDRDEPADFAGPALATASPGPEGSPAATDGNAGDGAMRVAADDPKRVAVDDPTRVAG